MDYKTKYEAWCKKAMLRYERWLKGERATKYDKVKHVNVRWCGN